MRTKGSLALAISGFTGALLLTVVEWLLLPALDLARLPERSDRLLLPLLMGSGWLLAVLVVALLLDGVKALHAALGGRTPVIRRVTLAALALPLVVYGALLGRFTFSGRVAAALWYRPLSLALIPLLVAGILALPFALHAMRIRPWVRAVAAPACALVGVVSLLLNHRVLPEEYEPLHTLLSLTALLYAAALGTTLSSWLPDARRPTFGHVALATLVVGAVGCQFTLGRSSVLASVAYGSAVGARYLAAELPWDGDRTGPARRAAKATLARDEAVARERRRARAEALAPHIVVVSLDNVQASRVGAYGYRRHPTTPNIDALAERGLLFERAYSSYPRTRVFLSSMLTGRLLPPFDEHEVPESYRQVSLTRLLAARGYHVLVKGWFDGAFRFRADGYDVHTFLPPSADERKQVQPGLPHVPLRRTLRALRTHLEAAVEARKPVLAWLHFLRPHSVPPKFNAFLGDDKRGFGSTRSDDYDEAIASADRYLEKLQALAREVLGDERPVYWVIMSDHGAGFSTVDGEADFSMNRNVSERFVRVPLLVAGPGIVPGRSKVLVSAAIDVAATLLDLAGIEPPPSYDGMSLMPLLGGYASADGAGDRSIYLRYFSHMAVVRGAHKLTKYRGTVSLTDLLHDPHERVNLADRKPELARELKALVKSQSARIAEAYAGE